MDASPMRPDDAPIPPPTVTSVPPSTWIALPRQLLLTVIAFGLALGLLSMMRSMTQFPGAPALTERGDVDFSLSIATRRPVSEMVQERVPNTRWLLLASILVSGVLIAIGASAAAVIHSLEERAGVVGSILKAIGRLWVFSWASAPVFWLGLILIILFAMPSGEFALGTSVLPPGGAQSVDGEGAGSLGDRLAHLILPTIALSALPASLGGQAVARMATLRREPSRSNFVTGVLGLPTVLLEQVGGILSWLIVVELVFAYPGLGRLLASAVLQRDLPVVFGVIRLLAVWILLARLLVIVLRTLLTVAAGDAFPIQLSGYRATARRVWVIAALALLLIPLVVVVLGAGDQDIMSADPANRLAPPSAEHPLGTDEMGRDTQARLMRGAFTTLATGMTAALVILPAALLFGSVAGWLRTRRTTLADSLADLILLPTEVPLFFPALAWIILLALLNGPGVSSLITAIVLALTPRAAQAAAALWGTWPQPERLSIRWGAGIAAVFLAALFFAVQLVSAADFLGLGVQPPTPALGAMVSHVRQFLFTNPGQVWWPGLALWLIAFALYTAADALIGFFATKDVMLRLNQ